MLLQQTGKTPWNHKPQTKVMPGLQKAPPQAVWCLHKHTTFEGKKNKVEGRRNHNGNKSKHPLVRFLSPCRTIFLLFVAYVFSCLGADLWFVWWRARVLLQVHVQRRAHTHKDTRIDLFPPYQHSDNREKPICSAATSRKENMSNSNSQCVFFLPSSFSLSRDTERVQDIYFDIYTQPSPIGRSKMKAWESGDWTGRKKKNKKIPPNQQPDVLHWRRTRMKLCGILEWATSQPLQRKHHPSSPPRAPAGIRRSPTPAGGLHIWGELSGRGGHVGKHLQLCLKVGLNIRRLWWRKKRREKKWENVFFFKPTADALFLPELHLLIAHCSYLRSWSAHCLVL